jgi:UDP-GlcNAc:undecaprenyl-phosphate GlcNAc-1-phosphate transferase
MIQKALSYIGWQGADSTHLWVMLLVALQGLVVAVLTVPLIRRSAAIRLARQSREFHQTHRAPISRLGGMALAAAFLSVCISVFYVFRGGGQNFRAPFIVAVGALAMFVLGFIDDFRPLGAKRKLFAQILISIAVYQCGLRIENLSNPFAADPISLGAWSAPVTILWLVGMTNLINLIDGIDGLAGGICLMLMVLLMNAQTGSEVTPLLVCGVAGSLIGFLIFNFPPAKIYMGDGGAYFLGFFIGELTISNSHKGTVVAALVAPLFVLALPILDVSLAILRRGLKGLPLFRADRRHIHHRLLEMGLSRRHAVLWMYCFTVVFLVLGMFALGSQGKLVPILAGMAILIILVLAGRLSFAREWFSVGHVVGNSLRMREEVGYAVLMTRWLALEGRRVRDAEELWNLTTFAAERLGLSAARLKLGDGSREWKKEHHTNGGFHFARFDFHGTGVIEIEAEVCPHCQNGAGKKICDSPSTENTPCIGSKRMFDVVSELLAEGWHKGSRHLKKDGDILKLPSVAETTPASTPALSPAR